MDNIIIQAYTELKKRTRTIPADLTCFDNMVKNIQTRESLFITFADIIPFINEKENLNLNRSIVIEYQYLLMLIFITYSHYDMVLDDKQSELLPCGNMLFRNFMEHACRLGIKTEEAHNTTEKYNMNPNTLPVGKISVRQVKEMDKNFARAADGFEIASVIIRDFAEKYIPHPRINWYQFWRIYLLDRQFADDMIDYREDMLNNQIKSFGIMALALRYANKKSVNLNNPVTFIRLQSWIAKNMPLLEEIYSEKYLNHMKECHLNIDLFNDLKMQLSERHLY